MTSGLAPISICRQNKPQALLTALMHARESDSRHTFTSMPGSLRERAQARPAGLTVLLYFLGHLLEKYSRGDPDAAWQTQVIAKTMSCLILVLWAEGWLAESHMLILLHLRSLEVWLSSASTGCR